MANYDKDIIKYDSEYDSTKIFRYEKSKLLFDWVVVLGKLLPSAMEF